MKVLNKDWAKYIEKYSFIDKCEIKKVSLNIYYTVKEIQKIKSIPIRSNLIKLQKVLNDIKKEIGVKNEKRKRNDKISICAF
jgi:hypothetical protein